MFPGVIERAQHWQAQVTGHFLDPCGALRGAAVEPGLLHKVEEARAIQRHLMKVSKKVSDAKHAGRKHCIMNLNEQIIYVSCN